MNQFQLKIQPCVKALFLITLFLMGACQEPPPPPPAQPLEVVVEAVQQQDFPVYGVYIGTTHASLDVEVRARVNGFIQEISFTEGSLIKEGDLLYRIDNRPYKARVNRLKANLESAQAQLAKTERDVARYKPLYEQDAASQLDLDNALSAWDQAKAGVTAAAS
jgi:membrane fusion protein (multidrug efflux system)